MKGTVQMKPVVVTTGEIRSTCRIKRHKECYGILRNNDATVTHVYVCACECHEE